MNHSSTAAVIIIPAIGLHELDAYKSGWKTNTSLDYLSVVFEPLKRVNVL